MRFDQFSIATAALGLLVLLIGMFSARLRSSFLSESLLALCAGIVLGPWLGVLNVHEWGDPYAILERVLELTLAIGLMALALRLPKKDVLKRWRSVGMLLLLMMPLMWLSTGLMLGVLLGLPVLWALLAAACLAPTDPIVASSIVTGKVAERNLPDRLRTMLSEESGLNDGLAYPFVFLVLLLLENVPAIAMREFFFVTLLWRVGVAVVLGAAVGAGAGWLMRWTIRKKLIEKTSLLGYSIALSVAVLGTARLVGSDGILAVFIAAVTFDLAVGERERVEEAGVQEALNRFLTLPAFALFGAVLPWREWLAMGPMLLVVAAAVLLFRRLPWLLLIRPGVRGLESRGDAVYLGWFGPMGVAAAYYAVVSTRHTGDVRPWAICSFIVTASIVVHGLTATWGTRLYGRHVQRPERRLEGPGGEEAEA